MTKVRFAVFVALLGILSGCKNEKLDSRHFSSQSNISQETIQKASSLDRSSYTGLEHIFQDTTTIKSEGKFVLLIFGKNGCNWCDKLKDEIKEDQQIQEILLKNFQTYYINLSYSKKHELDFDGKKSIQETSSLARDYDIRPTPTSVFLDSKGKVIFIYPGYFTQPQMQVILNLIASKRYKQAKNPKEFFEMLSKELKGIE